jgi:uridylate kinase
MSAIPMPTVCEPYQRAEALRHLAQGRIVLFAGGTGSPFFTTDTTAALRAAEMGCDGLFKGTSVDGVYSGDPKRDATAVRFERIAPSDVLARNLKVMDAAAVALARDNQIPVIVFSIRTPGAVLEAAQGRGLFTIITEP